MEHVGHVDMERRHLLGLGRRRITRQIYVVGGKCRYGCTGARSECEMYGPGDVYMMMAIKVNMYSVRVSVGSRLAEHSKFRSNAVMSLVDSHF